MRVRSLSTRLLMASAVLMPVFLGLTGVFLDNAFQRSLQTATEERMRGQLYLLFSVAEMSDNGDIPSLQMPAALIEPEFERFDSGLYAFVYDENDRLLWQSGSVGLKPDPVARLNPTRQPGDLVMQSLNYDGERFFAAQFDIIWEDDDGDTHPFRFVVLRNKAIYMAELAAYRNHLLSWLVAAGLLLLIGQGIILKWGLRPLRRLARALHLMERGQSNRLGGHYPTEMQEVVDNLNQVLAREEAMRQRYRHSLSDLAHSLKTPLAVLQSSLDQPADDLRATATEQVSRMSQVVNYQLQRAMSEQQQGMHQRAKPAAVIKRLSSALDKVYREKSVYCEVDIDKSLHVAADEQDLMEVLGNMLENAYKYCRHQVRVSVQGRAGNQVCISISDDGPGVPEDERERILQRGQRLDTLQPGQGIGLSVVIDIVDSYGGNITVTDAELGGAEFTLILPAGST
ncbi:ATP-binding protein [Marinimicrobium alkaliphilum]|uniref:ATP-binding protein n=1 Tax=Marinimicrobium alkaliphilum TaxID=2202654 RepID=UPI001E539C6B|nr:ATP-binding protein [Marinimicrobium alkaliphilum]